LKVAIIGGGIGGMTLALSLLSAGVDDVDIFESAPTIRELGVGINVLPHGVRELAELDLLDQLYEVGIPTVDFAYYSPHGQRIWHEPLAWFPGRSHMLVPYLEKFPQLQVILDHCGVSRDEGNHAAQLERVFALAKYPNLALKWCHAPSHLSTEPYPFSDVMPHLRRAIEAFGPRRILWASDHTQSKSHHSWAQALYYVLDSNQLTDDEKVWVLGRSARTILSWPKPTRGISR
jgi:predicted TIM-barrel fold metal-dependent hydrolase